MTPLLSLAQAVPREGISSFNFGLLNMFLIFGILYFLLLRPQMKERQRHEKMVSEVKKGDEIVTNGGIIGKVVHVEESRLTVKTAENTRLTVDRGRIAAVVDPKAKGDAKGESGKAKSDAKGKAKAE